MTDNEELFKKYVELRSTVLLNLPKPEDIDPSSIMRPLIVDLKTTASEIETAKLNVADVALNSGVIERISGNIVMAAGPITIGPEFRKTAPWFQKNPQLIHVEAGEIKKKAEKRVTIDDISEKTSDYIAAATEAQIIAKEFELAAQELNQYEKGGDTDSATKKIQAVVESTRSKVVDIIKKIPGRAKSFAVSLKEAIEKIPTEISKIGKKILDEVAPFLKAALERLQQFMAALIGDMFDFAAWIQGIAAERGFAIREFGLEVPSFEVSVIWVGPVPLPIPKFQTPKLSVSFGPQGLKAE